MPSVTCICNFNTISAYQKNIVSHNIVDESRYEAVKLHTYLVQYVNKLFQEHRSENLTDALILH